MSDSAEAYLGWLGVQIRTDKDYGHLLAVMLEKEFVWLVANDDNRIGDALELRKEFRQETGLLYEGPCSVLEVLIGLSRRLEFMAGGEAAGWACQLLENLELHKFTGSLSPRRLIKVDGILEALVWRTYSPDGTGGFFPLAWPEEDQTKVEIWYQMAAYVEEIHPEY